MVGEVHHNVLEFEVSVDDKNRHHVVKPCHELSHDGLHDARAQMVVLEVHYFLQVVAVTQLHENVVASVSLDSLTHFDNVLRVNRVLILNLAHDQVLLGPAEG